MAEELISALSRIPGLNVASRTSAFAFKGKEQDVRSIGQRLQVTHVLEGSVRKSGERLRVTVQLTAVRDGYQLWTQRYDRDFTDVFAIQDDIARSVVNALKVQLGDQTTGQLFQRRAENLEAYHLYLKGQFFWNQRHKGGLRKALECYNEAIAIEPTYAQAYAGLAGCFVTLAAFTYAPPQDAFPKARAAAQKALQLDESLAEAHTTLGVIALLHDWDWPTAEREHLRALELDSGYPTGHSWVLVLPDGGGARGRGARRAGAGAGAGPAVADDQHAVRGGAVLRAAIRRSARPAAQDRRYGSEFRHGLLCTSVWRWSSCRCTMTRSLVCTKPGR